MGRSKLTLRGGVTRMGRLSGVRETKQSGRPLRRAVTSLSPVKTGPIQREQIAEETGMANVEEREKQIIGEQLGGGEAEGTPTASFVYGRGVDWLDQMGLTM